MFSVSHVDYLSNGDATKITERVLTFQFKNTSRPTYVGDNDDEEQQADGRMDVPA